MTVAELKIEASRQSLILKDNGDDTYNLIDESSEKLAERVALEDVEGLLCPEPAEPEVLEGVVVGSTIAAPEAATPEAIVDLIRRGMANVIGDHLKIAHGMKALQDDHGWSVRQIAAEVGVGKSTVHNHLSWLALGDDRPTYGERVKAIKAPKPAPASVVEPEPAEPGTVVAIFREPVEPEPAEPEIVEGEIVEPQFVADWTLTHSPAERFASHLATAVQAMEAAYVEARANPGKFTGHPMSVLDQTDLIKVRARAIESRVKSLVA